MPERQGDWLQTRVQQEHDESESLSSVATRSGDSRGRLHAEEGHLYRTAFQRDRDRVVHSTAFRRLQYKTQVFVYHEGDHYRNRLTHSLEGAQIARTIARALRLNEDLAEAIALAHDLGHTPFGHAGERVLADLLSEDGGFDHNRQCLRVVDLLEMRDPRYAGLNLTEETREGILKHGCHWFHPVRLPELLASRGIEAQVADAADEIAYVNHDLDDALRAGVLTFEMLGDLPLVGEVLQDLLDVSGDLPESMRRTRIVVALINRLVTDLIESTAARLADSGLDSADAVRRSSHKVVTSSPGIDRARRSLKAFLFDHFYNHPRVSRTTRKAERIVADLFRVLCEDPGLAPAAVRARFPLEGERRAIADYVAGMTDRYAVSEHRKLLDPHEGIDV
jgi:dGTPase